MLPDLDNQEKEIFHRINTQHIPYHVAIIMDGNGRWAKKKGLPRIAGHRAGMDALRETIRASRHLGVKILTVYAFSTENWKRPGKEVQFLMKLPEEYFHREIDELYQNRVKINMLGDMGGLPDKTRVILEKAMYRTRDNDGMIANFALNYGSRQEIVRAVRAVSRKVRRGELEEAAINEELFSQHLYTAGQPDPDLLIRPSGELRISNFLLWQIAYSELVFYHIFWPEFKRVDLLQAVYDYQQRQRRFGGVK